MICLGVIIRGETPHFDYVAAETARGINEVGLKTGVPVMFGVITANTVEQALARAGVKRDNKGYDAALAAVELVNLYQRIILEVMSNVRPVDAAVELSVCALGAQFSAINSTTDSLY